MEAARSALLARGYSATTVDEVCAAAGVSKGSFYHAFDSKEAMGLAVLEAFYRDGVARVRGGDYLATSDRRARLEGFLRHLERTGPEFWRHGCLMGSFAAELSASSLAIRTRVAELFDELVASVAPLFTAVLGDADEARELAEQMLAVLEGSIVLARAHDDPGRIGAALRRFRRMVELRLAAVGLPD